MLIQLASRWRNPHAFGLGFPDEWGFLGTAFDILVAVISLGVAASMAVYASNRLRLRERKGARSMVPTCPACGYPASGLAQLRCPECSCDFSRLGLHPPVPCGPSPIARWLVLLVTATAIAYSIVAVYCLIWGLLR